MAMDLDGDFGFEVKGEVFFGPAGVFVDAEDGALVGGDVEIAAGAGNCPGARKFLFEAALVHKKGINRRERRERRERIMIAPFPRRGRGRRRIGS